MNILPDFPDQPAPEPAPAPAPAPRPKRRRLRNLLLGAAGLLVLLLAALALTAVFFPVDALRGQLIKAIESGTGYRCEIGELSSNLLGGSLTMRDLRLSDPARALPTPLLEVKEANLLVALTSLPGAFSGKPIVVERIAINGGGFNCALFEPRPAPALPSGQPQTPAVSAAPTASGTPGTPGATGVPTVAAGAQAALERASAFQVKHLVVKDMQVFGRASAPEHAPLRITGGEISMLAPGAYRFSLEGQGRARSATSIEGEIRQLEFPAFDRAVMSNTIRCKALRQEDFCELLDLPNNTEALGIEPVDGELLLEYADGRLSMRGKISTPALAIAGTPPFPQTDIELAVQMDTNGESFSFQKLIARAADGALLDASGTLGKTADQWALNATIRDTALPATLLYGIIGRPDYAQAVGGKIRLQGALNNAAGWNFAGKMQADSFTVALLFPQEKGTLTADIACGQTQRQLQLGDIRLAIGGLTIGGEVRIPLGQQVQHDQLHVALTGGLDLQTLKNAPAPLNAMRGKLGFRLDVSGDDANRLEYAFTAESPKSDRLVVQFPDIPAPVDAGEFLLRLKGRIPLTDWAFSVDEAVLRSAPAQAELRLRRDAGGRAVGAYAFQIAPTKLIALSEQFLPSATNLAEAMNTLSGRGTFSADGAAVLLPDADFKAELSAAATATLRGAYEYTPATGSLSGKKSELQIQRDAKTVLQVNADFRHAPAGAEPLEELAMTLRGDIAQALELANATGHYQSLQGSTGQTAANVRYQRKGGTATIAAAANINRLRLVSAGRPVLQIDPLSTLRLEATVVPDQQLWDIRSLTFAAGQNVFLASAKGTLNFRDSLSGQCQITSDGEIGELLRFFSPAPLAAPAPAAAATAAPGATPTVAAPAQPAVYEPFLRGRVHSELHLEGTADAPLLTFSASAPMLSAGPVAAPHTFTNPTLSGKIDWRSTAGGVRDLLIREFEFRSENESFSLKGRSDVLRVVEGPRLDFGQGMACNFLLRSTRSLLALAFPRTHTLVREQGRADSLQFSGLLSATSLPLGQPLQDAAGNVTIPDGFALRNGIFKLDELKTDYISLKSISALVSLIDGQFKVERGTGDLGGLIQFGLDIDFNARPAQARATTSGLNLNLPACLSGLKIRTRFDEGRLSFPWPLSQKQIVATWRGLDLPSIRKTLYVPETGIHIDDMRLTTKLSMPDFYKMFSYDFPEDVAREAAKRMESKFAERYATPITPHYKTIDLSFKVEDEVLTVTRCFAGGGNTADFELEGKLFLDGRLDMYLRPVKNMANTFDASVAMADPSVQKMIAKLPVDQQAKAVSILPGWMEEAANRRKLAIHIIKDIDDPTIDPQDVRNRIKAELPYIMEKIAGVLNDKELIRGILGANEAKEVTDFLDKFNR